jgi:hypothetical protein
VIQDSLSELMGDIASIAATLERKRALFPSLQRQHEVAEKEHEQIMHLKKVKEDMVSIKCTSQRKVVQNFMVFCFFFFFFFFFLFFFR